MKCLSYHKTKFIILKNQTAKKSHYHYVYLELTLVFGVKEKYLTKETDRKRRRFNTNILVNDRDWDTKRGKLKSYGDESEP
ncbi:MAG: hypothetical protein IPJ20_19960 [Flammeovirgaceae bacterium]|nr:hypothetical protein [Flammeovirgaceae bacterium]